MERFRRQHMAIVATLGAALFSGAAMAQDLSVAVAGPFTGQQAVVGEQFKHGAELFIADQNAKGGVLGKKLALTEGDDQCDPRQAVAVANQLSTKKVAVVIGHARSGSTIPASDVYHEEGILMITPSSTNPLITERGYNNVFRTLGRDDAQGSYAGNWMAAHYKGKKIAVVDDKSAYGKGLGDEARKALNKAGIKEAFYDQINAGDKDYSALVSRLKLGGIEVLYFAGYHPEAGLIARQSREQGMALQLIGGDALNTSELTAIGGQAANGILYTFAPDARLLPSGKDVVERLKKQGYDPEGYTLYTYAAFQVFAQAAEKTKSLKLDDLTKAMRSSTFPTVVGDLSFDAKGDVKQPVFTFNEWKDGKSVPVN